MDTQDPASLPEELWALVLMMSIVESKIHDRDPVLRRCLAEASYGDTRMLEPARQPAKDEFSSIRHNTKDQRPVATPFPKTV